MNFKTMQNPGDKLIEINGNPAVESVEPLPILKAAKFAIGSRKKSNKLADVVARLRCAAGKRRERQPKNPITATVQSESYRAATFDAEADAYQVRGANGQVLFGKSISNGNVRDGQKTRAFFTNNGRGVIDVKPKGRDIVIRPQPKPPVEDEEIWPVTSAFLYSRIKLNQELLDGNGAADADETTWDAVRCFASPTGSIDEAVVFFENKHLLCDYDTAEKALLNQMRADRLVIPAGSPSASFARDSAVWGSGSADAVMCWYYIGNPADAFTGGKIFKVSGPPMHPNAGNVTESGPGLCMEIYSAGGISAAIFPDEGMAQGPLTKELSKQFPALGGRIGYAGRIEKWRGLDYSSTSRLRYFRSQPSVNEPNKTPTSVPSWYTPNPNINPWVNYTDSTWFEFGWPDSTYIGCASTSWILAVKSNINSVNCAGGIPNDSWYWGGDAAPTIGRIDANNPQGSIGTTGMYVCWAGHRENMSTAMSFFQTFRTYWGIAGSVTYLGSTNPYGCEITPGGGNFPPAPPSNTSRFVGQNWGRKAEMWLKVCRQNDPPLELKLPFEYCAVLEKQVILGGGSFMNGANFEAGKTRNYLMTYGLCFVGSGGHTNTFGLELPHATLAIDDEFAYIDILYGAERIFEQPQIYPVRNRLGNQGFGGLVGGQGNYWGHRIPGRFDEYVHNISGLIPPGITPPQLPLLIKDVFTSCQSYKIKLPTKDSKTLTIVESQKLKRGQANTMTNKNPDWEYTQKFTIHDARTSGAPLVVSSFIPRFTQENLDFSTFGGLPALNQFIDLDPNNINNFTPKYYKPVVNWSQLDKVHYKLMGSPRQFNPLTEILPPNIHVASSNNDRFNSVIFDTDRNFGGHGRSEKVMIASRFGYPDISSNVRYSHISGDAIFPTVIPFIEQICGNGLIENGILVKWYRVTESSFPKMGQLPRDR